MRGPVYAEPPISQIYTDATYFDEGSWNVEL
jgi:hypothetical protein